MPIAQTYQVPLDELVGAPASVTRASVSSPRKRNGRLVVPLTRQPKGLHAWKVIIPPERNEPRLRMHEGYEWLYVLSGTMRLILGEHDITLGPGEVAEFDTRVPHWFGPRRDEPVEMLSLLGRHGEHMHVRAAPRRKHSDRRPSSPRRAPGRIPESATTFDARRYGGRTLLESCSSTPVDGERARKSVRKPGCGGQVRGSRAVGGSVDACCHAPRKGPRWHTSEERSSVRACCS